MKKQCLLLLTMAFSILSFSSVHGIEYKKFNRTKPETVLATLTVDNEEWTFEYLSGKDRKFNTFAVEEIRRQGDALHCGEHVIIDELGIRVPDFSLSFDDVGKIDVVREIHASGIILKFIAKPSSGRQSSFQRRMRDIVSCQSNLIVEADTFIRGAVIAFSGDVHVKGEVNKDVIALLGDILVDNGAVVRGDVISVAGKIKLEKDASVYGVVKSGKGKYISRRSRAKKWKRINNGIGTVSSMSYNRVDGLAINLGMKYDDRDSLIPSFHAVAGYAFASNRWRYDIGLSQSLLRGKFPLALGGNVFRSLKSDDDRIISESENSVFAFLVNEDWKDYYDAEGAYVFLRAGAFEWNSFEIGYLTEEYLCLDAHPRLWSLFGQKEFRGNYSSVPYNCLVRQKDDLNDKRLTSLIVKYTLDRRDDRQHPRQGWYGFAIYEFSPQRWKGDFDFTRIEFKLRRYQRLNRYQSLFLTGAYGYAHGDYVPLNRYFFLGGLGTLHGYRHKEFMGREYVYLSAEYRFTIPAHDAFTPYIQYDGGKIAENRLGSTNQWLSSMSVGVDLNRHLRLFVSKRLDKGGEKLKFYARFSASLFN